MFRFQYFLITVASLMFFWALVGDSSSVDAADCKAWDISGTWNAEQTNIGNIKFENLEQSAEGYITGYAEYQSDYEIILGELDGSIQGNSLEFTVYWATGSVGIYRGTISPTGRINGQTFDRDNSGSKTSWHSSGRRSCAATEEAIAPEPLPTKKLGKKKIQTNVGASDASKVEQVEGADTFTDPTRCKSGFVWREARPDDLVCVTPEVRARTAKENAEAVGLTDPDGAYGPNTCISGYVWREAFEGDLVCVSPDIRDRVREENSLGQSRSVGG